MLILARARLAGLCCQQQNFGDDALRCHAQAATAHTTAHLSSMRIAGLGQQETSQARLQLGWPDLLWWRTCMGWRQGHLSSVTCICRPRAQPLAPGAVRCGREWVGQGSVCDRWQSVLCWQLGAALALLLAVLQLVAGLLYLLHIGGAVRGSLRSATTPLEADPQYASSKASLMRILQVKS